AVLVGGGVWLLLRLLLAWRLEAGLIVVLIARPSLDVIAETKVASAHGSNLNPASVLALLIIAIGAPYLVERWRELRNAPSIRPYMLFALLAAMSVVAAPSKGSALTELLRLLSILFTYALVYLAASSSREALR